MKNKKHITVFDIPLGMYLSVENDRTLLPLRPVRDASLTGCRFCGVLLRSTERYIPIGMRSKSSIISNLCLYVVYFPFINNKSALMAYLSTVLIKEFEVPENMIVSEKTKWKKKAEEYVKELAKTPGITPLELQKAAATIMKGQSEPMRRSRTTKRLGIYCKGDFSCKILIICLAFSRYFLTTGISLHLPSTSTASSAY